MVTNAHTFRLEAIAIRLEAISFRSEAIAIRLEAIAIRLEAIAFRSEAIAFRLEAIAIRLGGVLFFCGGFWLLVASLLAFGGFCWLLASVGFWLLWLLASLASAAVVLELTKLYCSQVARVAHAMCCWEWPAYRAVLFTVARVVQPFPFW